MLGTLEGESRVGQLETHFEQIPVAVVKKMVEENLATQMSEAQVPDDCAPARQGWRELAQQVQAETDPQKMLALVQQLITNLDEEQFGKARQPGLERSPNAG
jgi:hypothetical protein